MMYTLEQSLSSDKVKSPLASDRSAEVLCVVINARGNASVETEERECFSALLTIVDLPPHNNTTVQRYFLVENTITK